MFLPRAWFRAFLSLGCLSCLLACPPPVAVTGDAGTPPDAGACADCAACPAGQVWDGQACVTAACSDGVDNDGDGHVDWQYDLGCTGPLDATEGGRSDVLEDGWTVFEAQADTTVFYVSSSLGDDAWSGTKPEPGGSDGPLKTVAAALGKLKDGKPDWLLFRRGDTWVDEPLGNWKVSGREGAPFVISTYGASTQRPRFELTGGDFFITHGGGGASANRAHLRVLGLHVVMASKDPDDPRFTGQGGSCVQWLRDGGDVVFEDLRCDFAQFNLQSNPTLPFTLRRSVLQYNYSLGSHAQSMFTSISAPLLVEENLALHGGWSEAFRLAVTAPSRDAGAWAQVGDGRVGLTLPGQRLVLTGLDFTGATGLPDVAARLEAAINAAVDGGPVTVRASAAGALLVRAPTFPVGPDYGFVADAGGPGGTDLAPLLNLGSQGVPESTIFNRNMYLSHGKGHTTVRGNIDARGASGGVQQRMGGTNEGNLFLEDPHGVIFGSSENDPNYEVAGVIRDNVMLGSHDISTQVQGTGIQLISSKAVVADGGPSLIKGVVVSGNLLAHNQHGTGNIKGIALMGDGVMEDVEVRDNVLYAWARPVWPNEKDQRAHGLLLNVAAGSGNIRVHDNVVQQVDGGFVASASNDAAGVTLHHNTYWSAAPNPPDVWSRGWFELGRSVADTEWVTRTGESSMVMARVRYVDPTRGVASYMASLGQEASVDAFLVEAAKQSRLAWRKEYTAAAVNAYVRAGFALAP